MNKLDLKSFDAQDLSVNDVSTIEGVYNFSGFQSCALSFCSSSSI